MLVKYLFYPSIYKKIRLMYIAHSFNEAKLTELRAKIKYEYERWDNLKSTQSSWGNAAKNPNIYICSHFMVTTS